MRPPGDISHDLTQRYSERTLAVTLVLELYAYPRQSPSLSFDLLDATTRLPRTMSYDACH